MAAPPQAGPTRAPGGETARVSRIATRFTTLKKRPEFLAARKGGRWATPLLVVEAVKRPDAAQSGQPDDRAAKTAAGLGMAPRFGFTVSKQVGGAVERNRIKRRLRAAVAQLQTSHAAPLFDYVLIARRPALEAPFETLLADLAVALERSVQARRPSSRPKSPKRPSS